MAKDKQDESYYRAFMSHRYVSRRGLLRGLFSASKTFIPDLTNKTIARQVGRPPQAISETDFLQQCIGCDKCLQACPYGLISINHNLAEINIDFCYCTTDNCLACTPVCPTGALNQQIKPDTALWPDIAQFCFGRHDNSCRLCVHNCPQQALSFSVANEPIIDEVKCDGCGQCKIACIHGLLTLKPGLPQLTKI
ncbi:4Fe-4S binding protein [Arsenophonus nasoniae]|uniref:4Fe-4S binding protein n=1 Tax=Arsenophonus nasoniae TaxID=638 RepID=A0AA95GCU5_9GAMM|nr:4Fe-4S binding protein [Arsenophonus nasoniae]WGL96711.1 4Fe-4S binding protein [Arsenophonus nasoniae]